MGKIQSITHTIKAAKENMPAFPSTRYIEAADFQDDAVWTGAEKIDGANMGVMLIDNEVVIRNRDHVLRKGYVKDTPAKKQFLHAWNWAAENKKKITKLNQIFGESICLYGEWCYALHGIKYDNLPDYFVAFDVYCARQKKFFGPIDVQEALNEVGISYSPIIYFEKLNLGKLTLLVNEPSGFSNLDGKEGIYLKKLDGKDEIVDRAKFIRPDYIQNSNWDAKNLQRQRIN